MDLSAVNSLNSLKDVNIQAQPADDSKVKKEQVRTYRRYKSILKTSGKVPKEYKAKMVPLAMKQSENRHEIQATDILKTKDLYKKKQMWLLYRLQNTNTIKKIENKEMLENSLDKICTESSENLDTLSLEAAHSRKKITRNEPTNTRNVPNILRSSEYKFENTILVTSEEENEEDIENENEKGCKTENDKIKSNHKRKQVLKVRDEVPVSTDTSANYEQSGNKNKNTTKIGEKKRQKKNLLSNFFEEKRPTESPDKKMNKRSRRESRRTDENSSDVLYPVENEFIPSISLYNLSQNSTEIYKDRDVFVAGDEKTKDLDLYDYSSEYTLNKINSELNEPDYIDCLKTNFMDISDSDEIHKLLCPMLEDSFSEKSCDQNGNNINVYDTTKSADINLSSDLIDCESWNLPMPDFGTNYDNILIDAANAATAADNKSDSSDVEVVELHDDISAQQKKGEKSEKLNKGSETEASSLVRIKELQCPLCALSFKTSRTLAMHRAGAHGGPFIFQCETCGLLFNKKYTFNRHSIDCLHRERRFICVICNKNYKHRSSLLQHARKAHQVHSLCKTSYTCQVCSKPYKNYSAFEKHLALHCE